MTPDAIVDVFLIVAATLKLCTVLKILMGLWLRFGAIGVLLIAGLAVALVRALI
jgi:hypothetical protein